MLATLQFSPLEPTHKFASKTFCFNEPATLQLDGHIHGMRSSPAPTSTNAIFPSLALAIDQAFVRYDGSSFTLTTVDWHSDPVCVNGNLLGDHAHTLSDGDKLTFGRYRKEDHSFEVDCGVLVRFWFHAPTTTNWRGVRQLLNSLRQDQARDGRASPHSRHDTDLVLPSHCAPTPLPPPLSASTGSPAASTSLPDSARAVSTNIHASTTSCTSSSVRAHVAETTSTGEPVADVIREIHRTTTSLCSKIDALLPSAPTSEPPPSSASAPSVISPFTSSKPPPPSGTRYEDILAELRARSPVQELPMTTQAEPPPSSPFPAHGPDGAYTCSISASRLSRGSDPSGSLGGGTLSRSSVHRKAPVTSSLRHAMIHSAEIALERVRSAMSTASSSFQGTATLVHTTPVSTSPATSCLPSRPDSASHRVHGTSASPSVSLFDVGLARLRNALVQLSGIVSTTASPALTPAPTSAYPCSSYGLATPLGNWSPFFVNIYLPVTLPSFSGFSGNPSPLGHPVLPFLQHQ
ncbi:hypothetical protein A4X13_0g8636 [Tilletia indica]|uniref:Uncharacterized protein n=1 Tax=Tilletia indica TaxID=43049 RepID=A0A177T0T0_9BASI|nr:hypothetical protein A4X13_0g8636 [Tilletia indica]